MTTADYIGGTLKALQPVQVLTGPTGTVVKTVNAGGIVGKIYSWVVRDGVVFWQLESGQFVKHGQNIFDLPYLENSLKKAAEIKEAEIQKKVEQRQEANKSVLYQTGKDLQEGFSFISSNLKWLFVGALVIVFIVLFIKLKS